WNRPRNCTANVLAPRGRGIPACALSALRSLGTAVSRYEPSRGPVGAAPAGSDCSTSKQVASSDTTYCFNVLCERDPWNSTTPTTPAMTTAAAASRTGQDDFHGPDIPGPPPAVQARAANTHRSGTPKRQ